MIIRKIVTMPKKDLIENKPIRFYEVPVDAHLDAIGCVDGRKSAEDGPKQWVKMLGSSLHLVYLAVLFSGDNLNETTLKSVFAKLKAHNRQLGVHRGAHKNPSANVSDCGAGDRIVDILTTVKANRQEIESRMMSLVETLKKSMPESYNRLLEIAGLPSQTEIPAIMAAVKEVLEQITSYDTQKVEIKGERLIQTAINNGASIMELIGNHGENRALVNLKPGVTFDTVLAFDKDDQAFDLDLAEAVAEAEEAGVDRSFATIASLVLYLATEMVLVEQKGKRALPVYFYQ